MLTMKNTKVLSAALLAGWASFGQTAQAPPGFRAPPAFEAAAVHELSAPFRALRVLKISGTLVTLEGYNPAMFVAEAYGVKGWQIFANAVPPSARGTYYAVDARAPEVPSKDDVHTMLRTLLADRFHLVLHHETRNIPVYALVVDKNGPRLPPGTGDAPCASFTGPVKPDDRNYRYRLTNCTLDPLADLLSADRPIANKTGLTGLYDISIFATPDFRMRDANEPGDITAADAVKPLGLRLEAQNTPLDVIVVDHFDPAPTPN